MPQYDVFRAPGGRGYLLDVQTDWLDVIATRVVAPLVPLDDAPRPSGALTPVFEIEGRPCALVVPSLSAVPASSLRHPVANVAHRHDAVTRALDLLLHGF